MWCPSATLSMWSNAWLAGKAAPDDVLDALSCWAPKQSVTAYDSVAAGHTGLPWPDVDDAGAMSLLQTMRTVAGRATMGAPVIGVVLPVPGDVRGLPAGTRFEQDALAAGEAMIVTDPDDPAKAVGLVPEFEYDDVVDEVDVPHLHRLSWTVYSLPGMPVPDHQDLGEAEHALRSAVRSAADALTAIGVGSTGAGVDDPRGLVDQLLESDRHHRIPDHAPPRAVRVLEKVAHVDAIISVTAGLSRLHDPSGPMSRLAASTAVETQSSSQAQIATDALRPLAPVVRSAQMAAVSVILRSAWWD